MIAFGVASDIVFEIADGEVTISSTFRVCYTDEASSYS